MILDHIKVCARCRRVFCRCQFGTYKASTVYSGWLDFLRDRLPGRGP